MRFATWWFLLPLLLIGLQALKPISLPTADLGRHLMNGRLILEEGLSSSILTKNTYSYVAADFPVLNHHWLFGVISVILYELGGFNLLSILVVACLVAAGGLSYAAGRVTQSPGPTVLALLFALPLITHRTEVRPELISLVLFSLYFFLLQAVQNKNISSMFLWILLPLQLLWVNSHLFFILGIWLTTLHTLFAPHQLRKRLALLTLTLILISCLSPFGWRGLTTPLTIFNHYEYQVAENQSLGFMIRRLSDSQYSYAAAIVILSAVATMVWTFRRRNFLFAPNFRNNLLLLVIAGSLTLVTIRVSRMIPFWGVALVPLMALWLQPRKWARWLILRRDQLWLWSLGLPIIIVLGIPVLTSGLFLPRFEQVGFGLPTETANSIEFMQKNLPGPVFNNYDIGGMLIWTLYPRLSVYTDNRPEAYPLGFFPNDYVAPQEDTNRWQALLSEYQFESIVFYRHDMTPWAQPFLLERIAESDWQAIYVDSAIIVLVRETTANQFLIQRFGLPKSIFTSTSSDS